MAPSTAHYWPSQCALTPQLLLLPHPNLLTAAPTFVRCTVTGKKVGLHAYGSSAPRLEACAIEKCGAQGVRAQESATPALLG